MNTTAVNTNRSVSAIDSTQSIPPKITQTIHGMIGLLFLYTAIRYTISYLVNRNIAYTSNFQDVSDFITEMGIIDKISILIEIYINGRDKGELLLDIANRCTDKSLKISLQKDTVAYWLQTQKNDRVTALLNSNDLQDSALRNLFLRTYAIQYYIRTYPNQATLENIEFLLVEDEVNRKHYIDVVGRTYAQYSNHDQVNVYLGNQEDSEEYGRRKCAVIYGYALAGNVEYVNQCHQGVRNLNEAENAISGYVYAKKFDQVTLILQQRPRDKSLRQHALLNYKWYSNKDQIEDLLSYYPDDQELINFAESGYKISLLAYKAYSAISQGAKWDPETLNLAYKVAVSSHE